MTKAWNILREQFGPTPPDPWAGSVVYTSPRDEDGFRAAAERFASWAAKASGRSVAVDVESLAVVDEVLARFVAENAGRAIPAALGQDAVIYLGEVIREAFGGVWREGGALLNPVGITGCGGLEESIVYTGELVEARLTRGFSLAGFVAALPKRFVAEREKRGALEGNIGDAADPVEAAAAITGLFREFWQRRYKVALPVSLTGVREVDGFLRSHYYVRFVDYRTLLAAGFFLGEVGRGLFGGDWVFEDSPREDRAFLLRYPELDYRPIGRVLKMMDERPEGEALDEYIRLVPSARAELRKQGRGNGDLGIGNRGV